MIHKLNQRKLSRQEKEGKGERLPLHYLNKEPIITDQQEKTI
nr:hypothetical protein [Mycoplasmopsis bovis]